MRFGEGGLGLAKPVLGFANVVVGGENAERISGESLSARVFAGDSLFESGVQVCGEGRAGGIAIQ